MTSVDTEGNRTLTAAGANLMRGLLDSPCAGSRSSGNRNCLARGKQEVARIAESIAWDWPPRNFQLTASVEQLPAWLEQHRMRLRFAGTSLTTDWAEGISCSIGLQASGLRHLVRVLG